jgi:hypothetical protein
MLSMRKRRIKEWEMKSRVERERGKTRRGKKE